MIICVWVNELLTRVTKKPSSYSVGGSSCVCLVCTVYRWGYRCGMCVMCFSVCLHSAWGGHCLVKLKEERWHAVSLSWRSPLNSLAPPDTFYSDQGDRRAPPACWGIPPFNWAFTQDSFHSAPQASLGADTTMRVTKLGLTLFRLRGWENLDLHKDMNL